MKEYFEVYIQNQHKIEEFIEESLNKFGDIKKDKSNKFKTLFKIFPSLELVYIVNKNTKIQTSPNYYRFKEDEREKNISREYLISKLHFKENTKIAFSSPYISSATRHNCITVTIKEGDDIIFFDFKIETLLERLNIIELNKPFHTLTKGFYLFAGYSMFLLAIYIVCYSIYDFAHSFLIKSIYDLDAIFKPVIALTLGIAIFDLAKTILEQEVYFKSYSKNSKIETKIITKFLIAITIALSIEALMVVFKIALTDYDKMINALYLITGISMILIALSVFIFLTKKKN